MGIGRTSRPRDRYIELVHRFPLRPLRSDAELEKAIAIIDELVTRDDLTPGESDYLDITVLAGAPSKSWLTARGPGRRPARLQFS